MNENKSKDEESAVENNDPKNEEVEARSLGVKSPPPLTTVPRDEQTNTTVPRDTD